MRRMARVGPYREFTQGTLFSCACAEAYPSRNVYGMVVTARCDAAHGKAKIINYVPIIKVEDWILTDGCDIVARRLLAEGAVAMKAALRDAQLAPEILETIAINAILAELAKDESKQGGKILERFEKAKQAVDLATKWLASQAAITGLDFLETNRKLYVGVVKDLLSHSLAEFQFLESVEPDEDSNGYVALLREIRFIPLVIAEAIAEGLDNGHFSNLVPCEQDRRAIQLSFEGGDDYAMPLGTIESPDIEFVMQRLTQLFARSGVADVPRERAARLHNLLPNGTA